MLPDFEHKARRELPHIFRSICPFLYYLQLLLCEGLDFVGVRNPFYVLVAGFVVLFEF